MYASQAMASETAAVAAVSAQPRPASDAERNPTIRAARRFQWESAVSSTWFAADTAVFITEDGVIVRVPMGGGDEQVAHHDDLFVAAHGDGRLVAIAGSDGRIIALNAYGESRELGRLDKNRWVSALAVGAFGVASAVGRNVAVHGFDGCSCSLTTRSPVGAAAFSPDGSTLALSTRDELVVWHPETDDCRILPTPAGHAIALDYSPDGRFIAECLYEPGVGVRSVEGEADASLLLKGPAAQVRSVSWSPQGDILLTSGARQLMVWPIVRLNSGLSSLPRFLAPYSELVTAVAYHPSDPIAAVGYADGLVLLVRLTDGAEIVLKRGGAGAISGITWSRRGDGLAIGAKDGQARLFAIDLC
jgi:WD40 repeat protein